MSPAFNCVKTAWVAGVGLAVGPVDLEAGEDGRAARLEEAPLLELPGGEQVVLLEVEPAQGTDRILHLFSRASLNSMPPWL